MTYLKHFKWPQSAMGHSLHFTFGSMVAVFRQGPFYRVLLHKVYY